jgi:ribosome-associated heat shock protein Hsp15
VSDLSDSNAGRLDKWLFCARLCRTRETAQAVIAAGKVRLNGARTRKPGHAVRLGDILTLALGGRVRAVKVLGLAERRGGAPEAALLYEALPD